MKKTNEIEEILYVERKKKPGHLKEKYEEVVKFLKTDVCSMKKNFKEVIDNYDHHQLLGLVHPAHREYHAKKLLALGKITLPFYKYIIVWN